MSGNESKIKLLERALERERLARKAAEEILEKKSLELFNLAQALKQSNERLGKLLSEKTSELKGVYANIQDAYIIMNFRGIVLEMNKAAESLFEFKNNNQPINLLRYVKKEYLSYTRKTFNQLIKTGSFTNYKIKINTAKGNEKFIQVNASVIYNSEGNPVAMHGIARDITEERNIQKQFQNSLERFEQITELSQTIIWEIDSTGIITYLNGIVQRVYGYSPSDIIGKYCLWDFHVEVGKNEFKNFIKDHIIKMLAFENHESRFYGINGETICASLNGSPYFDEQRRLIGFRGSSLDITKRKRALEQQRILSEELMEAQNMAKMNNWEYDFKSKISKWSSSTFELYNIDRSINPTFEYLLKNRIHPEDIEIFNEATKKLIEGKEAVEYDYRILFPDNTFKWLHNKSVPIFDGENVVGVKGINQDIHERKKRNLQLLRLSLAVEQNPAIIQITDMNAQIEYVNPAFEKITGYSFEEVIGKNPGFLKSGKTDINVYKDLWKTLNKKMIWHGQWQNKKKNGGFYWEEVLIAPVIDEQDKVINYLAIKLDITQRKKMENQREELLKELKEKNEQLNDYAHVVSHDLKSPLRNLSALISWTSEDYRDKLGDNGLKNLSLMQETVEKMDNLIVSILNYSSISKDQLVNKNLNLNVLLSELERTMFIPDNIQIFLKDNLPIIYADETRILQLFQNIISNAINYNDKEVGIIEIDYVDKGSHYIFSVKDNGIGIAREHHERIFKIFNSLGTKKKSTGIGLSIVKKIIELYDGKIWLESELGVGTTFFFSIRKN